MHTLYTAPVRLGTSGATIDGRVIDPEWLVAMAANYDPAVYTAVINWEHRNWAGNFGKVVSLEVRDVEDDKKALYGVLAPNEYLVEQNKNGQSLFTSMEINLDFADTGEPYLSGLAVTDRPASLGSTELRFNKQDPNEIYATAIEHGKLELVDKSTAAGQQAKQDSDKFNADEISLARKIFNKIFTTDPNSDQPNSHQFNRQQNTEDAMTPQELEQFNALQESVVSLTEKVESLTATKEQEQASAEDEAPAEGVTTEQLTALQTELTKTKETVTKLTADLEKALGKEFGSTDAGGDSGEEEDLSKYI